MVHWNIGDRVEINSIKYSGVTLGTTGTVKMYYGANIAVKVDGHYNTRSEWGYYYYPATSLRPIKDEATEANGGKIMEGNYRVAHIKFLDGTNNRTYLYACYDQAIKVGDICVLKTANHGFAVGTVEEFTPKSDEKLTREIVCRADFTDYYKREVNRARKAELVKLMKERASALQEIALYKMLAGNDENMADMVHEYEQLEGVL